jgi:hypothetical protein
MVQILKVPGSGNFVVKKLAGLVCSLLLWLLSATLSTAEPLRCNFEYFDDTIFGVVICDVVESDVTIVNVIFNRGNCPTPIASENDYRIASQDTWFQYLSLEKNVPWFKSGGILISYIMDPKKIAPLIRVLETPRQPLEFGDFLSFNAFNCPNLIEYEICTANDGCRVWEID